jgi:hypothetical protein
MGVAVLAFAVGVARKGERTLKGDMKAFIAALPPSSEYPLPLLPPPCLCTYSSQNLGNLGNKED